MSNKLNLDDILADKFKELHEKVYQNALLQRPSSHRELQTTVCRQKVGLGSIKASLDDIEAGIIRSKFHSVANTDATASSTKEVDATASKLEKPVSPHIKITLRITENILLYEQRSTTALRDSEEGRLVEADNQLYENLLSRKDKEWRRLNAEVQTSTVLRKSREVNTEGIAKEHAGAYVSNFEMFDTYKDMEQTTKSVDLDGQQQMEVTTYKLRGVDQFEQIRRRPSFDSALMITMRALAGNVYEPQQRRFRNMQLPDPLAEQVHYLYRLELLWRNTAPPADDGSCNAVADMSWCPCNGDILAVAYGIYSYGQDSLLQVSNAGCVCVWNIKNPVNAERCFQYEVPVVCVEFSPFVPQLLAVGLHDGSLQVRDITHVAAPAVASSQRGKSPSFEPIVAVSWMPQNDMDVPRSEIAPFLALSRNGAVTKYRITSSPHLLGYQLIQLARVEGVPEGLSLERAWQPMPAGRQPQGLDLALDPLQAHLYYVLTDEGCLHKCSTNYPQEHLEVRQLHEAGVNAMEFSPWSPKLFLTCGNDWCVRIWLEGILQPLITLKNGVSPVHCAHWSRTHSTVLISLSRKSIDVWDIRHSTQKPLSSNHTDKSFHTLCKLSNCGRSLAVGNENGDVLMLAFEDMPFPAHFQYEALEAAIFAALSSDANLTRALKSLGYFGYAAYRKKKVQRKQKQNKARRRKAVN